MNGKALEADKYEFELKRKVTKVVATAKKRCRRNCYSKKLSSQRQVTTLTLSLKKQVAKKGVTYDTAKHEVKVKVTDNGQRTNEGGCYR